MYINELLGIIGFSTILIGFIVFGISEVKNVFRHGLYKRIFIKRDVDELPLFKTSLIIMLTGLLIVFSAGLIKYYFSEYDLFF